MKTKTPETFRGLPGDSHSAPRPGEASRWVRKGLRTRYRPDQRLSRGLVTSAPWVDLVLLFVFFLLCHLPFVMQPGIAIDLPTAHISSGHPFGHSMMVVMQASDSNSIPETIIFFDDRRFQFNSQRDALRDALQRAVGRRPDLPLVIEADQRIQHGLMVDLYTLATEAGIREVNVATRPY